ncbi:siderophore-interacting protein [Psychrobacter namhaensis]|uniref:siderophore-interacting protein n=1 Tax=Psychrobacter namhaensis TaxID=292734 RepID=UPI003D074535
MAQPLAQHDINKTPLAITDKDQFVSHINEEHQDELAMFINAFTKKSMREYEVATIKEIYSDGILLEVITPTTDNNTAGTLQAKSPVSGHTFAATHTVTNHHFIHFTSPISDSVALQEQYITLLQKSASQLGKRTIKLQEQRFTVMNGYYASPNLYRLVVTAPASTPLNHPGYAYLFELDSDGLLAPNNESVDNISADNESVNQDKPLQRYYTLRKAWQDSDSGAVQAWIDVYVHGDTPGGNWARSLTRDMQIKSVREYPEKTEHLTEGQCLLICDETSLPTVANLLENWQNPLPPLVITITNDPEDVSYLHTLKLSDQLRQDACFLQNNLLHIVNAPKTGLAAQIVTLLQTQLTTMPRKIDKVWGALEATDIKSLRPKLKATLGLSRQDMVIKVYWRVQ